MRKISKYKEGCKIHYKGLPCTPTNALFPEETVEKSKVTCKRCWTSLGITQAKRDLDRIINTRKKLGLK